MEGTGQGAPVDRLTEGEAAAEVARLTALVEAANAAYHRDDAPILSDAAYDALKLRLAAVEARFPSLARPGSPTAQVGYAPADGFGKVAHRVPMLSLANEFAAEGVRDFDARIRRFLGLAPDAPLAYVASGEHLVG